MVRTRTAQLIPVVLEMNVTTTDPVMPSDRALLAPRESLGRNTKIWSVVRVSSGNFLEMYDFMVFGYYAAAIGQAFFPSGSAFSSLMLSLMTFGAGFLMRPLGAIVLGAYTDRHGRRAGPKPRRR